MIKFTPTQQRILAILSDGHRHTRDELMKCLDDDMTTLNTLRKHISLLRPKINQQGTDIVSQNYKGKMYYRHMRILVDPNDGKR